MIKYILLTTVVMTAGVFYMTTRKTLNVRNNNPLNIRKNERFEWLGEAGSSSGFVVFDSVEYGFRAAYRTMQTYKLKYGLDSIAGIINRWAPDFENPTNHYVDFVEQDTGISRHAALTTEQYAQVLLSMSYFEGAKGEDAYTLAQVKSGVALAWS